MFTPTELFHENLRMVAFGPEQMEKCLAEGWTTTPQARPIATALQDAVDKRSAGRPKAS